MRHRLTRGIAGAVLLALAGVGFGFVSAGAQEEQEVDATVARQAYFTRPATEGAPPLLFNGFPPSTACLVAGLIGIPQLCGEDIADLAELLGLADGLPLLTTPDGQIIQPVVLPGTTPVGMLLGQERYASLLQLGLPAVPEGEQFGRFELVMHQSGLNFALESPAFRQIVFAAIEQIDEPDPTAFTEALARIVNGELPALAQSVTGIEACPLLEAWNGGDGQDAALDGTRLPDSDCIRGTTGVFDPATATWTFDITFAAQAWTSDDPDDALVNNGIILRPLGAPNLAYGDPDLSTNFLISLGDGEAAPGVRPTIRYTTVPARRASTAPAAPTPSAPAAVATPGSVPRAVTPAPAAPAPTVITGLGAFTARYVDEPAGGGRGDTSPWLLLLVPLALAGAYLFGGALLAEPPVVRRQPGALSHLMARRAAPGAAATEEGVP